jgi:uncharacterized protein
MDHSIMYHKGNRRLQDQSDSRRISDRLGRIYTHTVHTRRPGIYRERAVFLCRDSGCRGTA